MIHQHAHTILTVFFSVGGKYIFDAVVNSMPPYTGTSYWVKWLYAGLHAVAAELDKVHIPGSPADIAAQPKESNPPEKP